MIMTKIHEYIDKKGKVEGVIVNGIFCLMGNKKERKIKNKK